MKRYLSLSIFLFLNSLHSAAPPPPPHAPGIRRPVNPPTGLNNISNPGRGGVPTPTIGHGMHVAPVAPAARVAPPAVAGARGPINPPTGLNNISNPGRGGTATQTNEALAQFIAQQKPTSGRGRHAAPPPRVPGPAAPMPIMPHAAAPLLPPPPIGAVARNPIPLAVAGNHMLDVVNTTGNGLVLYIVDDTGRTHQQDLAAGTDLTSIVIPNSSVSVYVQNRAMCAPVSIENNLKGIVISPNAVGARNYTITPLVPHYDKYVIVYNNSTIQQLVLLEMNMPRGGVAGFLPAFIVGTNKLVLSKELNPQECCLLEIPNITHGVDAHHTPTVVNPTAIHLNIPSSNTGPYTLDTNEHNSFIITAGNDVIPST